MLTRVEPRNHIFIRLGQNRTNPFLVARGDKSAMRSFAKLLWSLVIIIVVIVGLSLSGCSVAAVLDERCDTDDFSKR